MLLISDLTIPVVIITFVGVAAGEYPGFKMNRASIAFVGAVLLVALQVLPASAALNAIDPGTLLLVFAMMVISAHLRLAGFFGWIGGFIARHTRSPRWLLASIILCAGVLAALFLNDAVVIVFTPLVVDLTRALRRDARPYLIGLAAAANIGSAATITGNPQNILIGVSSRIPYAAFLAALGPVALLGLGVAWIVLRLLYRAEFAKPGWSAQEVTFHEEVDRPLLRKSLLLTAVMLGAFLAGAPVPLAAITVAAALLVSRRTRPEAIFAAIDWSLLVLFIGLFVITGALEHTHIIDRLFAPMQPWLRTGVAPLAAVVALLSNLVSNVPAVLLFRPLVPQLADPRQAWLTLAMASTLAGNLTLFGSVANLIMAEVARSHDVEIAFRDYLRAGVPITLITIGIGVLWLSLVA
jgi:Na+/H+ antiporter NhaD/arsenite permease-like protein